MTRDWYKTLVLVMWLALPINALNYWRAWDQLPLRMAVHFDANWQPNGYTSKESAVKLGLGIMATMLAIFTIAMLLSRALKPSSSWPVLVISYLVLGVIWYGNSSIIEFNLRGPTVHSELINPPEKVKTQTLTAKSAVRVGHPATFLPVIVKGRAYV
jgi:hypothetical protein